MLVSKELELTLTGKDCGLAERAPMCGIPYHSASTYITRLIEKGYRVAICEQLTDPALSKGLVERDVIRIITPGTVVDPAMLDEKSNSYVLCVAFAGKGAALAYGDVSTGEFVTHFLPSAEGALRDEIVRISPQEAVTNDREALEGYLDRHLMVTQLPESAFARKNATELLLRHFQAGSLTAVGLQEQDKGLPAAGGLLRYLMDTQKNDLSHMAGSPPTRGGYHVPGPNDPQNLELTQSLRSGNAGARCCGCWTKPPPPWGPGCCEAGWRP